MARRRGVAWRRSCAQFTRCGGTAGKHRSTRGRCARLAGVADPPDRVRRIVADQQRTVRRDRHANRTAPYLAAIEHEPGEKILVLAARLSALVQRHADHFVASARGAVPGAVLGRENVAAIIGGKLRAVVERQLQGRAMRLQQNIRDDDFAHEVAAFARMAWILMRADVPPVSYTHLTLPTS